MRQVYRDPLRREAMNQLKVNIARRSTVLALIIGCSLTLINQWEGLFGNAELRLLPLVLVFVTPFLVISASQWVSYHRVWRLTTTVKDPERGLVDMFSSRGILVSALMIGLTAGTLNSGIVLTELILRTGSAAGAPIVLIIQAYSLPVLFGIYSQALAHQRATKALAPDLI